MEGREEGGRYVVRVGRFGLLECFVQFSEFCEDHNFVFRFIFVFFVLSYWFSVFV